MKNKKLAILAVSSLLVGVSQAATALIDFGYSANQTTGLEDYYNNVMFTGSAANNKTSGDVGLNDLNNVTTGWAINVTETGSGNGGAGAGSNVATFPTSLSALHPATALGDSLWGNEQAGSKAQLTVSISGLNPSNSYDLLFYGSRTSTTSTLPQVWSMTTGTGASDVSQAIAPNPTEVVDWSSVSPDASGDIVFTITREGSGSASRATAINFGSITESVAEAPEPSSAALFGLGSLALILRRRR